MSSPYVATIAISNFSGRTIADGQNDILNKVTITSDEFTAIASAINSYEVSQYKEGVSGLAGFVAVVGEG